MAKSKRKSAYHGEFLFSDDLISFAISRLRDGDISIRIGGRARPCTIILSNSDFSPIKVIPSSFVSYTHIPF